MKKIAGIFLIVFACSFSLVQAEDAEKNYNFVPVSNQLNHDQAVAVEESDADVAVNANAAISVIVYSDYDYDYIIDRQQVRKITHPYLAKEEIVDVWVKQESSGNGINFYPSEYIMNHYYLRLAKRQIQLVSQIRYDGSGNRYPIFQKSYVEDAWQDVIPMTKEFDLYSELIKYAK